MTVFQGYSAYYDLLYRDKDYRGEAVYVDGLIKKYLPEARTILDLGCGTGRHDVLLAEHGYGVTGVDRSAEMLVLAKERPSPCCFLEGDVRDIKVGEQFDVVISLFHVMSYQTTNGDVLAMMKTADHHLRSGGVFIFDFWHGPAVLAQRPERRVKELENDKISVVRHCTPILHEDRNVVDVNYEIDITSHKKKGEHAGSPLQRIVETHSMRYFFRPELELMLAQTGFEMLQFSAWREDRPPTDTDWNVLMAARKQ